jgi:hypothetical protein
MEGKTRGEDLGFTIAFPVVPPPHWIHKWAILVAVTLSILLAILFFMFFATFTTYVEHSITRMTI